MSEAIKALESIAAKYHHESSVGELAAGMFEAACIATQALAALSAEQTKPVAWMWEFIGNDAFGRNIEPCARSLHEMDPHNPPYPETWKPAYPLYASPIAAPASQPDMQDAYAGAREDVEIWKKRALEAEESCRRLTDVLNEENGPTHMGEPVIRASQPDAAAIRNKALEECAALIDSMHEKISDPLIIGEARADAGHNTLTNCAKAIRALATQSEPAQQEPVMQVDMDEDEVKRLHDFLATERPVALIVTDGRCGYGLYAFDTEYPDEGAEFITKLYRDAAPTAQQAGQPAPALPDTHVRLASAEQELKQIHEEADSFGRDLDALIAVYPSEPVTVPHILTDSPYPEITGRADKDVLRLCAEFLQDMHAQPVERTISISIWLLNEVQHALAAAPAPSADEPLSQMAQDAKRYRYLRDCGDVLLLGRAIPQHRPEIFDATIDAALSAQKEGE